jgi:hypothetical protein
VLLLRLWRIEADLLIFVESGWFARNRESFLDDDGLRALQAALVDDPEAGVLIRRTRGLRKLRWSTENSGKRGGLRIIYFLITEDERCLLLFLYRKGDQDDLTPAQERVLMELVQAELAARSR